MPTAHEVSQPPMDNDEDGEVEDVIRRAQRRAAALGSTVPFTGPAFIRLQESIAEFIRALVLEAARSARRQRSDMISKVDVDQASRYIAAGAASSSTQHIGTIGGLLLGAAISNGLNIVSSRAYSTSGIVVTGALLVVGAFLIAFHIARDRR